MIHARILSLSSFIFWVLGWFELLLSSLYMHNDFFSHELLWCFTKLFLVIKRFHLVFEGMFIIKKSTMDNISIFIFQFHMARIFVARRTCIITLCAPTC